MQDRQLSTLQRFAFATLRVRLCLLCDFILVYRKDAKRPQGTPKECGLIIDTVRTGKLVDQQRPAKMIEFAGGKNLSVLSGDYNFFRLATGRQAIIVAELLLAMNCPI